MKRYLISRRSLNAALILAVSAAAPVGCYGQTADPLDAGGKFRYHAEGAYGPLAIAGTAAYAAILAAS